MLLLFLQFRKLYYKFHLILFIFEKHFPILIANIYFCLNISFICIYIYLILYIFAFVNHIYIYIFFLLAICYGMLLGISQYHNFNQIKFNMVFVIKKIYTITCRYIYLFFQRFDFNVCCHGKS